MVNREEFYFDSRDNISKIHAIKWIPADKEVICVLQIAHGMAEYKERYEPLANYLAEKGILVVGNDHLGHGKSIHESSEHGYFCDNDSVTVVVRDMHRLKKIIQGENLSKPYFILGHSMGSFMLRNYITRYGKGIEGAIIVGTGNQPLGLVKFAKGLSRLLAVFQGPKHKSSLMKALAFGANNKRIKNPRTNMDWLSKDEAIVNHYISDDRCGFTFTLNGFHTLFQAIDNLNSQESLKKMPKGLPVMFLAGKEDPVGNYGKGVEEVYKQFQQLGMLDVFMKLYDEDRHEILNETDKEKVFADIYAWLYTKIQT